MSVSETDKALTYVLDNANVVGYVVCNPEGINFKSHLPEGRGDHLNGSKIASLMIDIVECAYKTLHAIKGPSEEEVERFTRQIPRPSHDEIQRFCYVPAQELEVESIRLRTKTLEYVIVPGGEANLIVVQEPMKRPTEST